MTPEGKGLYDEIYQDLHGMSVLDNVYKTIKRLRNMYGNSIHNLTDAERRILRYLLDNKLWQM